MKYTVEHTVRDTLATSHDPYVGGCLQSHGRHMLADTSILTETHPGATM